MTTSQTPAKALQNRKERTAPLAKRLLRCADTVDDQALAATGRPRLNTRIMVSWLYSKHAFKFSDEVLVQTWSENIY